MAAIKPKWTRYRYNKLKKTLAAEGKEYTAVMLAKKIVKLQAKVHVILSSVPCNHTVLLPVHVEGSDNYDACILQNFIMHLHGLH